MEAVKNFSYSEVKRLLDLNYEPNGAVLQEACEYGQLGMVHILLVSKVSPWKQHQLNNFFMGACTYGHTEVARLLLHFGAKCNRQALGIACRKNNAAMVMLILEHNVKPRLCDLLSTFDNNIVQLLLSYGLDVRAATYEQLCGHERKLPLLLKAGADAWRLAEDAMGHGNTFMLEKLEYHFEECLTLIPLPEDIIYHVLAPLLFPQFDSFGSQNQYPS